MNSTKTTKHKQMLNTITISVKAKEMEEKESAHSFKRIAEKSKIEPVKWKLSKSQTRGSKNGVE